ncbi:sugar phosphate isomerase/epimerase family protein [Paenibacillus beijingensis]|uniref:AP endonuclease n=1 Tax=Paenibacillus beijingensis TaxID=1126833 RepID=A0A0D5NNF6_9BACL|nr:sugar phosphate isomerase/epimerase family protein [Paenibacillus beijingensis]AJY76670.1 AP endonuclease [Paenibacillus beijingensis]
MKPALSIWSCHKYLYDGTWNNEDFIAFAAEAGAEGVELLNMFWKNDDELDRVKEALERNGLKLACFGAGNNFAEPDEVKRRQQVDDIRTAVDRAAALGASVVRVFAGDRKEGVSYDDAKLWIAEGLKEAAAYAEAKGIALCLENHGVFAGKAHQVLEIIQQVDSPALRSTFDMGNFLLVDDNPSEAIVKLLPYLSHVHVKDFVKVPENYEGLAFKALNGERFAGKVPGEGSVDIGYVFDQLQLSGYEDWLTVEYEGDEDQQLGSRRALLKVRELAGGQTTESRK